MKRRFGLSFTIASLFLSLLPVYGAGAIQKQSDNVFVGRGKVARKDTRADRATQPRAPEDERMPAGEDDDLKPMIGGRSIGEIASLEQRCLEEVNRIRQSHGVGQLELSEDLLKVARAYSRRMAEERFFAHTDPDGQTVRQRVDRAGIRWQMIGENLAYSNGYTNPIAVSVTGWLDSPGHRRNMLDPDYRRSAIGAWIAENGTVYFTEIFLK